MVNSELKSLLVLMTSAIDCPVCPDCRARNDFQGDCCAIFVEAAIYDSAGVAEVVFDCEMGGIGGIGLAGVEAEVLCVGWIGDFCGPDQTPAATSSPLG